MAARLFLPQAWINDGQRRRRTGIPEEVVFRSKPEIALDLVGELIGSGMQPSPLLGDCQYGHSGPLRQGLRDAGCPYMLQVESALKAWVEHPQRGGHANAGSRGCADRRIKPCWKMVAACRTPLGSLAGGAVPAAGHSQPEWLGSAHGWSPILLRTPVRFPKPGWSSTGRRASPNLTIFTPPGSMDLRNASLCCA